MTPIEVHRGREAPQSESVCSLIVTVDLQMSSPSCTSPLFIPLVSPANSLSPANSHGRVSVSPGGLSIASSQSSPCDATIHPAGSPPIPSLTGSLSPDHRLPNLEHASSDAPAHHPNPEAGSQKRGYHVIYDVENGTGFRPITPEPESMQPTAANDTAKDVSESDAIGSAEVMSFDLYEIAEVISYDLYEISRVQSLFSRVSENRIVRDTPLGSLAIGSISSSSDDPCMFPIRR